MPDGLGHKSYMQFGREATYGTGVAATHRLGFVKSKVVPQIGVIRDDTLVDSVVRPGIYQGARLFRATIQIRCDYQGLNLIWDGLFGSASYGSNGGATTGVNPYAHAFIEKSFLNSYTIQLGEGDIPTGQVQRLTGAKILGATIRGTAGQGQDAIIQVELDIVAQGYAAGLTPTGALTAVAALPVLFHEATTVDDGTADAAADVRLRNFELSLKSAVDLDDFYFGSLTIDEPQRTNFVEVKLTGRKKFKTKTMLDGINAFTAGSPKLVFGSTTSKRLTFDIGTAYITEYNHPVDGYGFVLQEFTWEAIKDVTTLGGLKLTAENTQALITT